MIANRYPIIRDGAGAAAHDEICRQSVNEDRITTWRFIQRAIGNTRRPSARRDMLLLLLGFIAIVVALNTLGGTN
ncbi:MAG TPA: hypothetical protein VN519_06520 [Bryobacteraceae bacterium]|nr:hypothetical protein [Bryobacteraceae bacterium]